MICCLLWILPPERSIWNGQRPCLHSHFFCLFRFVFFFVVVFCFSHLRGASGMVNVLVSIPRSLWGQETLNLPEYICIWRSLETPDWLLSKKLVSCLGFTIFSKPEPLNNLGEKDEDLELSEPLADAHAGALAEREAHKRMNCLLGEQIHELLSNAGYQTYIFFLGFHPSFWQEHFGVVDELKRRWRHVKLSMSIFQYAHLRCRFLQTPGLKRFCPPQGCAAWSYGTELPQCQLGEYAPRLPDLAPEHWKKSNCYFPCCPVFQNYF